MGWTHFDRMAAEYSTARPPYPTVLYDTLAEHGVIGRGTRVLEVGAGSGLATAELVARGCEVVAVEPGSALAGLLREAVPQAEVLDVRLEDAALPAAVFDSVVAATALHWVDLPVGLPVLHRALRPGGWLAVWRTVFGDDSVDTDFRRRVGEVVARRGLRDQGLPREHRPTVDELTTGGLFEHVRTESWRWSIDLTADQVGRLFRTFSDWTEPEVEQVRQAAEDLGGTVTEHYESVVHLLRVVS